MYRQVDVQPAKTGRSACKKCKKSIEKNSIRVKVVDDRAFQNYIKKHGRENLTGEGLSRGYFQTERGTISIEKYFVHLECYLPIHPHPKSKEYFRMNNMKKEHKEAFNQWLNIQDERFNERKEEKSRQIKKKGKKNK